MAMEFTGSPTRNWWPKVEAAPYTRLLVASCHDDQDVLWEMRHNESRVVRETVASELTSHERLLEMLREERDPKVAAIIQDGLCRSDDSDII